MPTEFFSPHDKASGIYEHPFRFGNEGSFDTFNDLAMSSFNDSEACQSLEVPVDTFLSRISPTERIGLALTVAAIDSRYFVFGKIAFTIVGSSVFPPNFFEQLIAEDLKRGGTQQNVLKAFGNDIDILVSTSSLSEIFLARQNHFSDTNRSGLRRWLEPICNYLLENQIPFVIERSRRECGTIYQATDYQDDTSALVRQKATESAEDPSIIINFPGCRPFHIRRDFSDTTTQIDLNMKAKNACRCRILDTFPSQFLTSVKQFHQQGSLFETRDFANDLALSNKFPYRLLPLKTNQATLFYPIHTLKGWNQLSKQARKIIVQSIARESGKSEEHISAGDLKIVENSEWSGYTCDKIARDIRNELEESEVLRWYELLARHGIFR